MNREYLQMVAAEIWDEIKVLLHQSFIDELDWLYVKFDFDKEIWRLICKVNDSLLIEYSNFMPELLVEALSSHVRQIKHEVMRKCA